MPDKPLTKTTGRRQPSCTRNPSARLAGLVDSASTSVGDAQQLQPTPEDQDSGLERTTDQNCSVATQQTVKEDSQEENSDDSQEENSDNSAQGPIGIPQSVLSISGSNGTDEESISENDEAAVNEDSTNDTEEEMAVPVLVRSNRKFERPPTFSGLTSEDVIDWSEMYNKIGDYNGWSCKEKHDHVFMYLKGSAEKWFKALTPATTTWLDVTVNNAAGVDVVTEGV